MHPSETRSRDSGTVARNIADPRAGHRLKSQNALDSLDHGRSHGWAMDALLSECIRPRTLSRLGTEFEYFVLRTHQTLDVMMVGPCMLCAQNALDHGRYHAPLPHPPLESACIGSWYHGCHGCSVEPWVICAQNAVNHGRCHAPPPPSPRQNASDHGSHGCSVECWVRSERTRAWTLLFPPPPHPSMEPQWIRPWYHGWAMDAPLGPGCLVLRMHQTMDVTRPPHPMVPRQFPNSSF